MADPYTPDQLMAAARTSIRVSPDPETGRRVPDPLPAMVHDGNVAAVRPAIELALGQALDLSGTNPAAYLRSLLRRRAMFYLAFHGADYSDPRTWEGPR